MSTEPKEKITFLCDEDGESISWKGEINSDLGMKKCYNFKKCGEMCPEDQDFCDRYCGGVIAGC